MPDVFPVDALPISQLLLLLGSLAIALGFECINGFHDTANAVATVIYTKALKPWQAVIASGFCNFLGVYFGGLAVAFAIVHLLPVDLLVSNNSAASLAMVLALLSAATLWNLGTWYRGLPASSSHTLIGAILGVGIANSILMDQSFTHDIDWSKAEEVGLSLLISPLLGFGLAALLLRGARTLLQSRALLETPTGGVPPWRMRTNCCRYYDWTW